MFYIPYFVAVFPDGTVSGKFSHPRHVQDGHPCPRPFVEECCRHLILTVDVRLVVSKKQIVIALHERVDKRSEKTRVATGEMPRKEKVYCLPQGRVGFVVLFRVVSPCLQFMRLVRLQAEQEKVRNRSQGFSP